MEQAAAIDQRIPARQVEQLAILALAVVLGLIGFAVHFLWLGAVVLMAVLFGLMASELRVRRGSSIVADVVLTMADEAKNVTEEIGSGQTADKK